MSHLQLITAPVCLYWANSLCGVSETASLSIYHFLNATLVLFCLRLCKRFTCWCPLDNMETAVGVCCAAGLVVFH